ncbi:MAG TPA: VanZ family protein [Thermoanaerobaculia bacterium]|nr:VanZ family protein [Thermoanaerobaculia bacterium]
MRAEPFRDWLPPLLWAGLILFLSGERGASGSTEGWIVWLFGDLSPETLFYLHYTLRKGAHVIGYAILGALNLRGFHGRRPLAALVLAALVAVLDESHQATSPLRTAALADIGFDLCGAGLGVMAWRNHAR